MKIAALVKQVASPGGHEMDALSRRAIAQGVELAAAVGDGTCTAITLGEPRAEDVLREAIAWGRTCSVMTDGVRVNAAASSPATSLAAAFVLAATLEELGPFDLVLLGARSSDDATGLLGPHLAQMLGLPFAASARFLSMQGRRLHVRCDHEDEWLQVTVPIPAVVSCATDLIQPCEATPTARGLVPDELIRTTAARPTVESTRAPTGAQTRGVAVVSRQGSGASPALDLASGEKVVHLAVDGSDVEEDIAHAVAAWAMDEHPGRVVLPDSMWGREIAGRVAVQLSGVDIVVQTADSRANDHEEPVTTITAERVSSVRVVSRTPRRPATP